MSRPLRIGIIAGEVSGDILAAGLMQQLRTLYPDCQFVGIAGPCMQHIGIESLFDMDELAVMGLVEVLSRLPRLLKVRKQIIRYFLDNPPDIFIGVDAPDFNITVELKLKQAGIKTVHYVSPSVWAWREKRIYKMKAAADLTLAFLPFEKAFYDQHQVPCAFVGHTMADAIPLENDPVPARLALGLDVDKPVLAVLPGSRHAEISMLAPVFLQTCRQLIAQFPTLQFVVPCVNARRRAEFETILAADGAGLPVSVIDGQARLAMTAADVILLSSGTATLEAMLVNRPMVVAYKVKPLTFWIGKKLVKIRMFSLPNLLAGKMIVPEFIQENCTPALLSQSVSHYLQSDNSELSQTFLHLHQKIRCNADVQAARAVAELIQRS